MGLGFATLVDPNHGASTTVLGQMFMMFGILTYLAINGHLLLLGALANSFQTLPIGAANFDKGFLLAVATWGGRVFETGLLVALPAMIALVMVNMALGVITRAAPQLNLFGVGFTISLLGGFFILIVGLDGVMAGISGLIDGALAAVDRPYSPGRRERTDGRGPSRAVNVPKSRHNDASSKRASAGSCRVRVSFPPLRA